MREESEESLSEAEGTREGGANKVSERSEAESRRC